MEKILQVLNDNKETIKIVIALCTFIISLLAILIKRRPKTLDDFRYSVKEALEYVPAFCSKVERDGDGLAKKNEVIDYLVSLVRGRLGRPLSKNETLYVKEEVSNMIEAVLSAPSKKLC